MFNAQEYITALTQKLKQLYGSRLRYVGLQGSYLRGEANENSDIDIMAVVDDLSMQDMDAYRRTIMEMGEYEKSCGFICGTTEMKNWNELEICHLLHTTKDYFGRLSELVPAYSRNDIRSFIKLSVGNLYHEICHRYIHAPMERSEDALPFTYKGVFFILQNLHYLESGEFINRKAELLDALNGKDKEVLSAAMKMGGGEEVEFKEAFELLFSWCGETMMRLQQYT